MSFKRSLRGFRRVKRLDTQGWEWQQSRLEYPLEKKLGHCRSDQQKLIALTRQFQVKVKACDRWLTDLKPLPHGRFKHLRKQLQNLSARLKEMDNAEVFKGYEEEA
jgi:hypothetical protein